MEIYVFLALSVVINGLLLWYITRLLRKFVFISENLADLFSGLPPEKIFKFLEDLVKKRLMFNENKQYLSLAVRRK